MNKSEYATFGYQCIMFDQLAEALFDSGQYIDAGDNKAVGFITVNNNAWPVYLTFPTENDIYCSLYSIDVYAITDLMHFLRDRFAEWNKERDIPYQWIAIDELDNHITIMAKYIKPE